jgi:hypothetical protein
MSPILMKRALNYICTAAVHYYGCITILDLGYDAIWPIVRKHPRKIEDFIVFQNFMIKIMFLGELFYRFWIRPNVL